MTAKPIVTPKLPADLVQNRLPHHIAVIMDGNGRWAKRRGLPRIMGHQKGVDTLKSLLRCCNDWGICSLVACVSSEFLGDLDLVLELGIWHYERNVCLERGKFEI